MANVVKVKDFVMFLSSIRGDLANVTAPPFFLAPQSFLEGLKCFTERPSLFSAPALEPDPERRAVLVVKWWLASLKSAFYVGTSEHAGIRKPLNPFLGELWFGEWRDESAKTRIVVEQVSHHPPITACYMYDDENGIRGEGYTRVEMTFSGYINVRQTGHAVLHIDKEDEDHLIPLPDFTVRGFMSAKLYPEITARYYLVSSSGYTTEVNFVGRGLFSGTRNSFTAKMYRSDDHSKSALYTLQGQWNDKFTITHVKTGQTETHVVDEVPPSTTICEAIANLDPWESRKAWGNVHAAIKDGNIQAIIQEKSKLEQAQREMRKVEKAKDITWKPLFFKQKEGGYPLFDRLSIGTTAELKPERTKGVWKFDQESATTAHRPFRGELTPMG